MIERTGRGSYYHSVVKHESTLYLSGVVADDLSAPMAGQTKQVLDKIAMVLEGAGSDVSKILSATVYIADFGAKDAMNEVWRSWFTPDRLPTRATVGVATLGAGVLIEVVVIAAR